MGIVIFFSTCLFVLTVSTIFCVVVIRHHLKEAKQKRMGTQNPKN